jgi:Pentatricopeptide repeat domain
MRKSNDFLRALTAEKQSMFILIFFSIYGLLAKNEATAFSFSAPLFSNFVTVITPKTKKTLHFRKDSKQTRIKDRDSWQAQIEEEIKKHNDVGMLPKQLVEQIPPVITKWARTRTSEGALKAQALLERYANEYIQGNPSIQTLEVRLFNIAMDGWTKSQRHDAPQRIQKLMRYMQDLRSSRQELTNLVPDVISMSSLCLAWAKSRSPDAATKANAILEYMEQQNLRPNTITYNAVLLAHVHSPHRDKALYVERILSRMKHRFEIDGHEECRPDICSYQSLIAAWSRTRLSGTPHQAEEVLMFLNTESRLGKVHLTPNCHCYVATIHAWSHSEERNKSQRAYELLCHMKDLYIQTQNQDLKPNVVAYTAVLNACALPIDKAERESSLSLAIQVMDQMKLDGYDRPNFLTYSAFLHVLGSTIPPSPRREKMALQVIQDARENGQVGYIVLEKLQIASPLVYENIVKNITEHDTLGNKIVKIPYHWGKYVIGERDPNRRVMKDNTSAFIHKANYLKLQEVKRKRGPTNSIEWNCLEESKNVHISVKFDNSTLIWTDEPLRIH